MRSRRSEHGLTLIELLVSVAVIALLSTLAAPKLHAAFTRSQEHRIEKDLRTIQDALEQHHVDRGYYPSRLGDLVKYGYLRPSTNFRSPVNKQWYFYAVDNNKTGARPQGFALGHAGKPAGADSQLHRSGNLPRGRNPFTQRAWAWYLYEDFGLTLFQENDVDVLPDPDTPLSLSEYRTTCLPGSSGLCDLWTN